MDPLTKITQGVETQTQQTTAATTAPEVSKRSGLLSPSGLYQPGKVQPQQNLVHAVTISSSSDDRGFWKSIILDVLTVLSAGVFGYFFARYVAGGFSFWIAFAALLLWAAMSVLEGFIQKNFPRRFLIVFLESIALVAFFYTFAWQSLAVTGIFVLICLLWGYFSVRRELLNTVEVRFFTASRKVVGKVVTAAVIFMIVMYAALANNNGNFFVSQQGFEVFFSWASGFVGNFYPTVPLSGSVGDFAQAVAKIQLQNNPAFKNLTAQQQNVALSDASTQVLGMLSPDAAATGTTSSAFYRYIVAQMQKLQSRFNNVFIGAWGLILFMILRSAGIVVVWMGQFVALVFYEILLATGFMRITEQAATKETISF